MRAALRRAFAVVLAAALGGCGQPLLSPKDERSQFDRYDRVRSNYAPQQVEDAYGRRLPNLRQRLQPRD